MTTSAPAGADTATLPFTLPLVGRAREIGLVARLVEDVRAGRGRTLLVSGDGGIGKTRLIAEATRPVHDMGWAAATGRAYALETAIPYAPFADALEPLLASLDGGLVMRLTRGDAAVLTALAPSLPAVPGIARVPRDHDANAAEQRARLHASILQFLGRLAERQPLLLVLENLQWADTASLELFHFLGRQLDRHRILLVGSWNDTDRELPAALRTAVASLRSLGVAQDVRLDALGAADLASLLVAHFGAARDAVEPFAALLHEATGGNPFFIEQTLRELVERGDLRRAGGTWIGWHVESVVLPRTVRDVLRARLDRLSPDARSLAEQIAVIGTAAEHRVLREVAGLDDARLLAALDELRADGIIVERTLGADVTYDVAHPMLRLALADSVGMARERTMHAAIAGAIERVHGSAAEQHAESIAAHWQRADPRANASEAVHWLVLAGRRAASRLARREAAAMLRAALDRADAFPEAVDADVIPALLDDLARLYRRLGEYHEAIAMCERARDLAESRGDAAGIAVAERRTGMAYEGLGRRQEAIAHFDVGIAEATKAGDTVLLTRLRLARGDCLQALGRADEAKREIATALELAERLDQLPLLARAHRQLLMLHLWTGPAHRAWAHARGAVDLAERSGERNLAWSAHWSAAVLAALTANSSALQRHLAEAARLADELRSPLLQLRSAEIAIEYHAAVGDWDRAIIEGEKAVTMARALDQTTLLARLLHWVGGVYLHRGDTAEAGRLFDEAWRVSGAAAVALDQPFHVHGALPAYVARVGYLHALGEHASAIALGRTALALAHRTGYIAWAVYRLLPTVAAAAIAIDDGETLAEVREHLAHHASTLAHPIGMAWLAVIDGEAAAREGRIDEATDLLQRAIAGLEAVPYAFDAASTRVRLTRVLQRAGETEEAVREARAALQLFESLGARPSVEATRALLRELGARMPAAHARRGGFDGLTAREREIVVLVARRLSNKEIGAGLDISARTVGTHLANVFDKVGVRDRTALGDLAREQGLHRA